MKPKFISQAAAKGHAEDKLEKIWKDWEAFAEYAFNKSHSTCYAYCLSNSLFKSELSC
jgi:DNA polymerase-3 subunit alpha